MNKPVAIIGMSSVSRAQGPQDDDWQSWMLGWDMEPLCNVSRYYEIHDKRTWTNDTISSHLKNCPIPGSDSLDVGYENYLQYLHDDLCAEVVLKDEYFPGAIRYPLERIMSLTGMETGYLESSIAYMLAHAFEEGHRKMGIWGVSLTALDEYGYQRPNLAYMLGLFRGQGAKIQIPKSSSLFDLSNLDDAAEPCFVTSDMKRFQLEYLLGRHVARTGRIPAEKRNDLMTSIFTDPPRYGDFDLPADWREKVRAA